MVKPERLSDAVTLYEGDCLEVLPTLSGIDAVVTDPPYGLEWSGTGFKKQPLLDHRAAQAWDSKPSAEAFRLIVTMCPTAIIWGGNYFADVLGSFKCPLIWDKMTGANSFADGELAWTSFDSGTLRIFRHQWCGAFKDSERGERNLHPTQKPVALMRWCIQKTKAPVSSTILDPFAGSGTTAIAAIAEGMNCILIEKNPKYCDIIRRRIADAEANGPQSLFRNVKHPDLFGELASAG